MPNDFGLWGITSIIIVFSSVIVDGGLSQALIFDQKASSIDEHTVFWTNIGISIVLAGILWITAPHIAKYYKTPQLRHLIVVASSNLILVAISSIHRTLLVKRQDFKTIAKVSVISVSISGFIALTCAFLGFGIWSLVIRVLVGQLLTILLFYKYHIWRSSLQYSTATLKRYYSYGINLFLVDLLTKTSNSIYYLFIGKIYSPYTLGLYTKANTFKELTGSNISDVIKRVSFSEISALKSKEKLNKFHWYVNFTRIITCISVSYLVVSPELIINTLIGNKWTDSIEILRILGLSALLQPNYVLNLNMLALINKPRLVSLTDILSKSLIIFVIIIGINNSIQLMLWALFVASIISYSISLISLNKSNIEIKYQLKNGIITTSAITLLFILVARINKTEMLTQHLTSIHIIQTILLTIFWVLYVLIFKKNITKALLQRIRKKEKK